jgi:Zn-dependent M32 family carboxypeptidase
MMPDGAAQARAAQKKVLAGIMHERETAPAIGKALEEIGSVSASLNTEQTAVVREAKRRCARKYLLDICLVCTAMTRSPGRSAAFCLSSERLELTFTLGTSRLQ